MDSDIAADFKSALHRLAYHIDAGRRRQPRQMQTHTGCPGELKCRRNRHGFCAHRDAGQTKPRSDFAIMGDPVTSQIVILRLQTDCIIKGRRILHGAQQHLGLKNWLLGLRKGDTAGTRQTDHLRQLLARQLLRQRADRKNPRQSDRLAASNQTLNQTWLIQRRLGIRRARHGGYPAGNCGKKFGLNPGQTGRQIDQTWANHLATGL